VCLSGRSLSSLRRPRRSRSTLFPYTTLFRSRAAIGHGAFRKLEVPRLDKLLHALVVVVVLVEAVLGIDLEALVSRVHHEVHNARDRKSTRLNSSHVKSSYAVFCLKTKTLVPA